MGKAVSSNSKGWILKSIVACVLILAAAIPLALLSGCSDNPVNQPSEQNNFVPENYFDLPYQELSSDGSSQKSNLVFTYVETEAEATVDDGGSVPLDMNGVLGSLIVLSNSVREDVLIIAQTTVLGSYGKNFVVIDFQPAGLTFSNSADLGIPASVLSPYATSGKLYWLNPTTNRWEFQESVASDVSGMLNFSVDHFSKYGISR